MRRIGPSRAPGFSLVELVIAVVLSGFIMAAVLGVAVRQGHFYTRTADVAIAGDAIELAEIAIEADILPLNPAANDVIHAGEDSLAIRTWRGVFAVCAQSSTASGERLTLRRLTPAGTPAVGDSAMVYSEGANLGPGDDGWLPVRVASTDTGTCADGRPARVIDVTGLSSAEAASLPTGAPLRIFRHGSYWFEPTSDGWHLMTDSRGGASQVMNSALAPAATESLELRFRYLDESGTDAASVPEIVRIDMEVTAVGAVERNDGRRYTNSRSLPLKLRNN